MSELLETAQAQIEAGDYKQATKTLERMEVLARYDINEARGLLRLATGIRDKGVAGSAAIVTGSSRRRSSLSAATRTPASTRPPVTSRGEGPRR
jgi:hypothetical protein